MTTKARKKRMKALSRLRRAVRRRRSADTSKEARYWLRWSRRWRKRAQESLEEIRRGRKPRKYSRRLTRHFHAKEFDCHDGTRVPRHQIPHLRKLCQEVLEPMRERFGPVDVHSGYRTTSYNRRVGGKSRSYHIYTLRPDAPASDISCAKSTPGQWARYANQLLRYSGGLGQYMTFVHLDQRSYKARW